MQKLLFAASTSFLRAFGVTFISFAVGILGATNRSAAVALSIAALAASIAAGLRTLQVTIALIGGPDLSFSRLIPQPFAAYIDSFVRTFIASFVVAVTGWLAAPNWGAWHAALLGALTGAAVAAVRALQGLITPQESPTA